MKTRKGYLYQKGSGWYLTWYVNGQSFTKTLRKENGDPITTRREAEQARKAIMAPFLVGSEVQALESIAGKLEGRKAELAKLEDQQNPALLISQTWAAYVASPNRPDTGPDTLAVYEGQFGQFVDWMAAQHPEAPALRDVSQDIAEEYAGHLNHGRLSPNTFNKHIRVLELVFRVVSRKAKLESNPWEDIQRKKLETASRRELTLEELKKVCLNASEELRPLFAIGVYTGLRLKDCISLRWGEVDFGQNVIRRVPSKTARRNPKPVIVPIHPSLRSVLAELPKNDPEYLLPAIAREYLSNGAGKKRVIDRIQDHFSSQGVQIYRPETGPGTGKRAVVEVGFHSLRHSFVSLCRASNTPLAVVEAIVGHSNPAMTRHYTHVGEVAAGKAIACLPSITGDVKPAEPPRDPEALIGEAVKLAETMTAKNWKGQRSALLALLKPAVNGQGAGQSAN